MRKIIFLAALMCMIALFTNAQPGILDTSFNPGTGADSLVLTTNIQSDGKIIIGGIFTSYNGTARNRIARLNADGSLDISFNPGTGANYSVYSTAVQSDEKIIIGGYFTSYNGTAINLIARLNADGSLDASFNPETGSDGGVKSIAIQSDGKIVIGGQFTSYNGTASIHIARLNDDGSFDVSFNPGTGPSDDVYTTAIQNDGKIIIGGWFINYNGTGTNYITRLSANGSLDASFSSGTGANSIVLTTDMQSDGKTIIGGIFTSYNGTARNRIARLNPDGSLDTSFNPGTGASSWVNTTTIQSDGKIIIGGDFTSYNGTAINRIARLNADGSLDASFNMGTGADYGVYTTAIQSDGKIIIGGSFKSYNGTSRNRVARILVSTIGITSTHIEEGISIYPVPFSDELTIEVKGYSKKLNFEIFNTSGQVVLNGSVTGKTRVQASQLASGVYLLKLENGKSIKFKKLLKE
ncbi:MAG: T9SS type A sorting domain-containing protein [Bacteroidales bacterium]|nr:T9SS type A sorting domain-containing protein [Bacteroidales bacterium]MCF8455503.1 T9SS type A sorting domain-containing protein [Bacteroidales bacterium]